MGNLTAFLIVRNEELLLPRCLASLADVVDAIEAVDTGSHDNTPEILQDAASDPALPSLSWARVPFENFGQARRAALARVQTEWALWIDADEALSPALRSRLRRIRATGAWDAYDAYAIRLENRVLGRVMHGRNLANQYRLRLFRTRLGAISPSLVHEGLQLPPGCRLGSITEPLLHDTLTSWRRYLAKVDLYTTLAAEAAAPRRPLYLLAHLLVTFPATMWREFFWRTGFRDGWPGCVWAATTAWSSVLTDAKKLRRG